MLLVALLRTRLSIGIQMGSASMLAWPATKDPLFRSIEEVHHDQQKRYGVLLDAGTGGHSLRWLRGLPSSTVDRIVAVSADLASGEGRGAREARSKLNASRGDRLVEGSWCVPGRQPVGIEKGTCDTIVADYLIGSMDGFTPYEQDRLLEELLPLLKADGWIHFVGLQPIYALLSASAYSRLSDAQKLVVDVARLRDSCILLAKHRPYREYPLEWIRRQIDRAGLELVSPPRTFGVVWKHATVQRQLDVARRKLEQFGNKALATAMQHQIDDLDARALQVLGDKGTVYSFDYVVSVTRKVRDHTELRYNTGADKATLASSPQRETAMCNRRSGSNGTDVATES